MISVYLCYCLICIGCNFFFFFSSRRRHTRCGRDWSSDVCSSDLGARYLTGHANRIEGADKKYEDFFTANKNRKPMVYVGANDRSEERRVGKECRSRWSRYH